MQLVLVLSPKASLTRRWAREHGLNDRNTKHAYSALMVEGRAWTRIVKLAGFDTMRNRHGIAAVVRRYTKKHGIEVEDFTDWIPASLPEPIPEPATYPVAMLDEAYMENRLRDELTDYRPRVMQGTGPALDFWADVS